MWVNLYNSFGSWKKMEVFFCWEMDFVCGNGENGGFVLAEAKKIWFLAKTQRRYAVFISSEASRSDLEVDLIKILHEGFDFKIEMLMCIANAKVDTPSLQTRARQMRRNLVSR